MSKNAYPSRCWHPSAGRSSLIYPSRGHVIYPIAPFRPTEIIHLWNTVEDTEEDICSSSASSSSALLAFGSDLEASSPLFSPGAPRPPEDPIEEGTEATTVRFCRIELGEQRRLVGIMQHRSSEPSRVKLFKIALRSRFRTVLLQGLRRARKIGDLFSFSVGCHQRLMLSP